MSKRTTVYRKGVATLLMSLAAGAMYLTDITNAEAIPAFARKYQANCALCHSNEPRLTPFGQQFLQNGYQFPGTQDGDSASKIVLEGQQGAVTVDRLSNMMAVRIRADIQKASFKTISSGMQDEGVDERVSVELPKIVNFFFAGTATKNLSYFLESEYNTGEGGPDASVTFERGFLQFSNLGGKQGVANLKVGRFDPSSLYSFPTHRQQLNPILPLAKTNQYPAEINRIPMLPLAFSSKFFGLSTASKAAGTDPTTDLGEGFAILPFQPYLYNAPVQNGISLHGRPLGDGSPLLYQVGVAFNEEAGSTGEQRTDTYAMLRYDFQAGPATAQVSGFYYNAPSAAQATLVNATVSPQKIVYADKATDITRTGIAARAQWGEFDVYGTYIQDSIDRPTWSGGGMPAMSVWETDANGLSAEVDWRFDPHWMAAVRYDRMDTGGLKTLAPAMQGSAANINQTVTFISPIIKYYPSPNIGLYARAHVNLTDSVSLPSNGVVGFDGQEHPASNLESMLTLGVDMAF